MIYFTLLDYTKMAGKSEVMKHMDKVLNSVIAIIATAFTFLFGDWDTVVIVLIGFMVLDYVTGVLVAYINKKISSKIGLKGLTKKFMIILILIGAVMLDRLMNNGTWMFRTLVCYFYIANEGISLLENAGNLGLPIPDKLKEALEQLQNKESEE